MMAVSDMLIVQGTQSTKFTFIVNPNRFNHINQMTSLTVITLSGFHRLSGI
jgi:hypothetical protein